MSLPTIKLFLSRINSASRKLATKTDLGRSTGRRSAFVHHRLFAGGNVPIVPPLVRKAAYPTQKDQTAFALRLAQHVAASPAGQGNVAISPLSIHLALALLAAGAKGPTLDEIVSALVGPGSAHADLIALTTQMVDLVLADGGSAVGGPAVSCANGVFVDKSRTLKPSFQKIVAGMYKSEINSIDFGTQQVAAKINSWIENATSGLIKELVPPRFVASDTELVLVNALQFKGAWDQQFDPFDTHNSEFKLFDGSSVEVPCMTSGERQFLSSYDGFKVLRLPYQTGRDATRQFSMYIFLPDAQDGLRSLQEKISNEPGFLARHLPMQRVKVGEFKLPKFKISSKFDATATLKHLGIVSCFGAGDADFSEMVESPVNKSNNHNNNILFASGVVHESVVEVDEGGTEVAAAMIMGARSAYRLKNPPLNFVADNPFIFLIRDDMTGALLLVGHVKNPSLA